MSDKFLPKLKSLFLHTKKFPSHIEKETTYSKPMFFYVKIILIAVAFDFIFSLIADGIKNNFANLGMIFISLVTSAIFSGGLSFISPFIGTAITHLGVIMFRGKEGFYNTYKPVTYSMAIVATYTIISTIILTIVNIINPIPSTIDTTDFLALWQNSQFKTYLILWIIIGAISMIHSLYAEVIGIAKYQKISRLRALLSAIIIPLIIFVLIGIIYLVAVSY